MAKKKKAAAPGEARAKKKGQWEIRRSRAQEAFRARVPLFPPNARLRPGQRISMGEKPAQQAAFLAAYRELGVIRYACDASGVPRATVHHWKTHDAHFAERYKEAERDAAEMLEQCARDRAMHGPQPSDFLLWKLLCHRMPEVYGEKDDDGEPIEWRHPDEIDRVIAEEVVLAIEGSETIRSLVVEKLLAMGTPIVVEPINPTTSTDPQPDPFAIVVTPPQVAPAEPPPPEPTP